MKNGNEGWDVLGDLRKRARGQRLENTERAKNQSDCRIRYRALWEKNIKLSYPLLKYRSYQLFSLISALHQYQYHHYQHRHPS